MPSTYTSNLRLTLPTTGENTSTWGALVNTGITALVDQALAGMTTVTLAAGAYVLTTANGAADEARSMVIKAVGTPGATRNIVCPAVNKMYAVWNATTDGSALTISTGGGLAVTVPNGQRKIVYCDGTNVFECFTAVDDLAVADDLTVGDAATIGGNLSVAGTASVAGALAVLGNTALGNAAGDTLDVASAAVTWAGDPTHSGNHTFAGSLRLTSPSLGLGYGAGSGGDVTQATSKSTAVTLNTMCGFITMNSAALGAGAIVSFTQNNSGVALGDRIVANHTTGGTQGAYTINAYASAGAINWSIRNNTSGSLAQALTLGFAVIKASNV